MRFIENWARRRMAHEVMLQDIKTWQLSQLSQLPNCEETKCARGQTLWFSSYLWIITAGWSSGRLVTLTW